uniref:Uncharacterized protein n=1 Tax=viral metagenome TaxID=1070528 RepID=A0A6C0DLB9_9ZZZZ
MTKRCKYLSFIVYFIVSFILYLSYIYATKNTKKLINIIDNLSNPFKHKTNTNTK